MRERVRRSALVLQCALALLALAVSCAAPPDTGFAAPPRAVTPSPDRDPEATAQPSRDKVSLHPAGAPSPVFAALDAHLQQHPIDRSAPAWRTRMPEPPASLPLPRRDECIWSLQTNHGALRFRLRPDLAPAHVRSTLWLTRAGYFDGLGFHRVIPGFMAQGGCPTGDGRGSPGYALADEIPNPTPAHDGRGVLSAANAGPDTAGSQFFITFRATPWLDGRHTIFGELLEGEAVLATLEALGTPGGKPRKPITILRADFQFREPANSVPPR